MHGRWGWLASGVALLLVISSFVPTLGFWVTDCAARYLQLINIELNQFRGFSIRYPLREYDPDLQLLPFATIQLFVHDGQLYSQYPPAFPYLSALIHIMIGSFALRAIPLAGAIGLLWGCRRLAVVLGVKSPGIAALIALFGTPLIAYAFPFWDILPTLALATWSLVLAAEATSCLGFRKAAFAAVLAVAATVLREEYLIWSVCLALTWLVYERGLRRWMLPAAIAAGVAMLFVFNYATVGTPMFAFSWAGGEHSHLSLSTRAETLYRYLALASEQPLQDALVFVALSLLGVTAFVAPKLRIVFLALGFCSAVVNRVYAWNIAAPLRTQLWVNSMAVTSPLVFLGLCGLVPRLAERLRRDSTVAERGASPSRFVSLFILLVFVLELATSPLLSAVGLHFGPRILMPVYPSLALWGFAALRRSVSEKSVTQLPSLAFALLLVVIGLVDSGFYVHRLRLKADLSASLMKLIDDAAPLPVITDVRWLATEMSPIYYSRPFIGIIPRRTGRSLPSDHAFKAAAVARKIHPAGALVITYGDIPSELMGQATVEPLSAAARIRFPDGSFKVEINKLRWK